MYFSPGRTHCGCKQITQSRGAQIDSRCQNGISPLIMACYNNHTSVVKLLTAKGAQVNSADNDGDTPLHYAVLANSLEIVKLLLAHHPDFLVTNKGQNPLDIAKEKHYTGIVCLLEDYIKLNTV